MLYTLFNKTRLFLDVPRRPTKQRILQSKQYAGVQDARALTPSPSPFRSPLHSPPISFRRANAASPMVSPSQLPRPPHSPSQPPRRRIIGVINLPPPDQQRHFADRWRRINAISNNYQATSSPIPHYQRFFT